MKYLELLNTALEDENLDPLDSTSNLLIDNKTRQAAFVVAVRLGECRLFDVDLPEEQATEEGRSRKCCLPLTVALAAVQIMHHNVTKLRNDAIGLKVAMEAAPDGSGPFLAIVTFEDRMEIWAAHQAILEAARCSRLNGDQGYEILERHIIKLQHELAAMDSALEVRAALIGEALDECPQYFEEIRKRLATTYAIHLPWWLDGTIERAWHGSNANPPLASVADGNEPGPFDFAT